MFEANRTRYLCSGVGAAGATSLGGVSFSDGGPALLLLGIFAAAGWWMFRRFGSGQDGLDMTAEAETELVAAPAVEQIDAEAHEDDRELVAT